jgi:uncharacterized protein YceK
MILSRLVLGAVSVGMLCGCATVITQGIGGGPYSGVKLDAPLARRLLSGDPTLEETGRAVATAYTIDLPFSAALDTVLLPITVPREIWRSHVVKAKQPTPDTPSESN